jgi:hypothetical protein
MNYYKGKRTGRGRTMIIHKGIDWKGREKGKIFERFQSLFIWKLAICPFLVTVWARYM